MTERTEAQRLADDYADACFNQGLHKRTDDPVPEQKRELLAAELLRLDAENAALREFAEWVLTLKTGGQIEGRARAALSGTAPARTGDAT